MKFPCRSAMMVPLEIMYFYNHSSAVRVLGLSIMEFVNWFKSEHGLYYQSDHKRLYGGALVKQRHTLWLFCLQIWHMWGEGDCGNPCPKYLSPEKHEALMMNNICWRNLLELWVPKHVNACKCLMHIKYEYQSIVDECCVNKTCG